jgi:hypothetical protein
MKTIGSWDDLRPYGIDCLTGEACGLSYRLLCDVTQKGGKILAKAFGITDFCLKPPWNRGGEGEAEHIGSIMLAPECLAFVAIFALLESGCEEVWRPKEGLLGIEPGDSQECRNALLDTYGPVRRYRYSGTAGDRNVHRMTGRVE